tara:strand:- start:38 stop:214 length:177 start_codon:yes stop_codon:yes gene_type:complete
VNISGDGWVSALRSWQLFVLVVVAFVIDLLVPDPIPLIDEFLLGGITLLLLRWKQRVV